MRYLILIFLLFVNGLSYQSGDRYKNDVIELKEELSIGVADGAEEYMFAYPNYIDADSKGNIYVSDAMDKVIKVYDKHGKYVRTIGREGDGPGEFRTISGIFIDKKDNLYVYDGRPRRFTLFNDKGEYKNTIRFPKQDKTVWEFFIDDMNNFLIRERPRISTRWEGKVITEINLYKSDMEFVKTIYSEEEKSIAVYRDEGKRTFVGSPYPHVTLAAYLPDGLIVCGNTMKYEFFIHSTRENSTKKITRSYKPIKVTGKEKDDYFKEYTSYSRFKFKRSILEKIIFVPKEKPPFRRIIADESGYLIFVTYEEDKKENIKCDLFDKDGNFLKKIYFKKSDLYSEDIPRRLRFKKDYIYGIVRPEDGWGRVVRYTVN